MLIPELKLLPGARLVCLTSTAPFKQAQPKRFRVRDAKGNEVVDMAALFNAENEQTPGHAQKVVTLSAASKPTSGKGNYRLPDGRVDLAAIFNDEARQANGVNMADVMTLSATARSDGDRDMIIKQMAKLGKVPVKDGGAAFTTDELKNLPLELLQMLLVNCPRTLSSPTTLSVSSKWPDEKTFDLIWELVTSSKPPTNPVTGKPYNMAELRALPLSTLEILSVNTPPNEWTALLAEKQHEKSPKRAFRTPDGKVDLGAIMQAEADASGLMDEFKS